MQPPPPPQIIEDALVVKVMHFIFYFIAIAIAIEFFKHCDSMNYP
jgi:hypothetical protein